MPLGGGELRHPGCLHPQSGPPGGQGIQFNNCYGVNALCSPGRASLLTGLIPSAHGVHVALPDAECLYPEGWCAIEEFETIPNALRANGYNTALIGKYHIGEFLAKHPQLGPIKMGDKLYLE